MVSMTIAKTTAEERAILGRAGFVHVTGLEAKRGDDTYVIGQNLKVTELGKWDGNNGRTVIVTTCGEIWLGAPVQCRYDVSPERAEYLTRLRHDDVLEQFAPHGKGAFVPCSNGEYIEMIDLLQRLADPDWDPSPWNH